MIRAMIINMLVTMVASKVVTSFITIAPLVAQDPSKVDVLRERRQRVAPLAN